jgi:branched-chain amino acid aminotransferase
MTSLSDGGGPSTSAIGTSEIQVYVNGEVGVERDVRISAFDSGLNFADGVFEGIRVYAGRVFRLEEHLERLYESARALDLKIPLPRSRFAEELLLWLSTNEVTENFHFRPIVTRGRRVPPRLDPRFCNDNATILFVGGGISPTATTGTRVVISSVRRPNPDVFDSKIKSLSYGSNLLARLEAIRRNADDAVMLDSSGYVGEATAANIFIVKAGRLLTPWPKVCLAGITRAAVFSLAQESGLETVERDLTPTELINADEVFFTGTGAEITPVVEVEGRSIGHGAAGEITLGLLRRYRELANAEGTPIGRPS